jgi:hypothetical protein
MFLICPFYTVFVNELLGLNEVDRGCVITSWFISTDGVCVVSLAIRLRGMLGSVPEVMEAKGRESGHPINSSLPYHYTAVYIISCTLGAYT